MSTYLTNVCFTRFDIKKYGTQTAAPIMLRNNSLRDSESGFFATAGIIIIFPRRKSPPTKTKFEIRHTTISFGRNRDFRKKNHNKTSEKIMNIIFPAILKMTSGAHSGWYTSVPGVISSFQIPSINIGEKSLCNKKTIRMGATNNPSNGIISHPPIPLYDFSVSAIYITRQCVTIGLKDALT